MPCATETPLPRRRPPLPSSALAACAAAFILLASGDGARAQEAADSPFDPTLTDPANTQRFGQPAPAAERFGQPASGAERFRLPTKPKTVDNEPLTTPPPRGSGQTGFDSTGGKKAAKPKPGEPKAGKSGDPKSGDPRPPPPDPPPPPGVPQQVAGRVVAPQYADRASYSDVLRPADALPRRSRPPGPDPFDPLGIRVGSFVVLPVVDLTRGYDTNPSHFPGGKNSAFTLVEPALVARSNWSQHELSATLRGSYSNYDTLSSLNRPMLDLKANGRIDVRRDTAINLEARYFLSTDYPGSPNLPADIAKLPIFTTVGGTAGLTQRFNRLELSGKATVDRTVFQDSDLTDGSRSSNHDRDYNQYGIQVRAGYELTPGLKPFVQVEADTRQHDLTFDRNGFQRDSRALTPRVGTTFEFSRILTGEASVGYLTRQYQDANLQDLQGVVADASLKWEPTTLTTATLTAASRGEEVVVAGVSGALRRDVGLQVDHAFRRWLIGTLKFGYGFDRYIGDGRDDRRTSLGVAMNYKLNREIWLKGEYRYDQLRSNAPGVDYDANVFMLGLKLQR